MNNLDPDILSVLRTIGASGESRRVAKVTAKHERQAVDRLETQLELLAEEVEAVIPRTHPLFNIVLIGAALQKVLRTTAEPEFRSYLDEGLPRQDW
jgi:hypothetical protein